MSTAIRLVRCPKCRKVLPELPNIHVYICGACGAILQAKKHKNDIKGNGPRAQETDPIQKHEPNASISSLEGDHPSIESSPGSDTRGEKSDSGSYISENPVDTNFSGERSHSTESNNLQDDKSSPEMNESTIPDERERLVDRDAGLGKNERNHISEKQRDRTSHEISGSFDSCHENEDSSSESRISGKQYEERSSPTLNAETSVNEIKDSNGVLSEEENSSGEPQSLDQHISHFSAGENLVDLEKEGQNMGKYSNEIEGSRGELAKEEGCSVEPQSFDDHETTRSPEIERLKSVEAKNQQNIGDEIGKYTTDMEDSQGDELSREGKHSNESQSFDEPATHLSVDEPVKLKEENKPFSEDKECSEVDEMKYFSSDNDRTSQNAVSDQIEKNETAKEASSFSMENHHEAETSLSVSEEYSLADENSSSHLEITTAQSSLTRSVESAPVSQDEEFLKESHEVDTNIHREISEEMLDSLPLNPRIPIAPISPDDEYLKEPHESGPSFHRLNSEENLDTLPIYPRFPIAPLLSDDEYLEEPREVGPSFHRISSEEEKLDTSKEPHEVVPSFHRISSEEEKLDTLKEPHEVGPSFHRISSEEEQLDTLKEPHEVGPSFHRISSEEEKLDTVQLNPRFPIAPLLSDDEYLEEPREIGPSFHRISSEEEKLDTLKGPHEVGPSFHRISSEEEKLDTLKESREVGPSFHRISSEEEKLDTLPINPRLPIAPLLSDDEYLEEPREVGPSFHRISSEGEKLDALKEPHEVGKSFHHTSSEEEKLDTLPINRRLPIAPLLSDDEYLKEPHEVGPSFHRISSEDKKLDTLKELHEVGPSGHRISSDKEKLDTLPINPRFPIAPLLTDDVYLEKYRKVGPSFHGISSEDMLDSPINPRVPIGLMSKSPTKIYYAGDESESLVDGTEKVSGKVSHLYNRKIKGISSAGTNRSRQKDGFRVKNKQNGELQMHNERLDLLPKVKEPNNFSGEDRDWRLHESPGLRKHSRPIRTSLIAANDEPLSRGSYRPRSSQLFHRNGSPASSTHDVFFNNGEFHRPDTLLGSDPEKNELLRMVYELEDKINSTHMSKQMSGERLPFRDVGEEIRTGGYYDDSMRNPYVGTKYSGEQRSHPQGVGWANRPRSSRLAFSGDASLCRNHIGCRCSHCYHQYLHFSPKLSSQCIHCQHEAHARHDYDNIYHSYSPSQHHYYTSSEFSHKIQADNQKQDHEMDMLHLREKHLVIKRHLRPFSGGAPIITCYHCSELLQLPAVFLLFKRRCHQLRCNSCNKILKFSLMEESHLVPYVIKIQAPPPSEMDDNSNIVDRRTLASTSRANNPQGPRPVPFSYDSEPSLSRNGSTKSLPSVTSSPSVPKNLSNGNLSSNHTSHAPNDRKMKTVMEIYQDTNKSSSYNNEAAGPSSATSTWVKRSSEIESATSCPPLHRLMGYESPRQVLYARSDDDSDDDSDDGMGFYKDQQIR